MKKWNKKGTSTRRQKRLRKIFFGAFMLLFFVIFAGFIVLWRLYPSQKLGTWVSQKLSASLDRPVQVKQVSVNPFGKIEIRDVDIGFVESGTEGGTSFLRMNRLVIHFKLLSLLRRRLDVTKVLLDEPELFIGSDILQAQMAQEEDVETDVAMGVGGNVFEKEPEEEISLPLTFGLFHLELNDFSFAVAFSDSAGEEKWTCSGIQLDVSDLALSRDFMEEPENVRGRVHLFSQEGRITFRNQDISSEMILDLDLSADWHPAKQWALLGNIGFRRVTQEDQSAIRLNLDWEGVGYGENVRINQLDLTADQQRLLHVEGVLDHLGSEMQYDFSYESDPLDLKVIEQTVKLYIQLIGIDPFEDLNLSGVLHLKNGELKGDSKTGHLLCQLLLQEGSIQARSDRFDIPRGNLSIEVENVLAQEGLGEGSISGDMTIDQLNYAIGDSNVMSIQGISLHTESQSDSMFIPAKGQAQAHIENVLGGSMDLEFQWDSKEVSDRWIENIVLNGRVQADSFQVASLPNLRSQVEGRVDLVATISANSLDDIRMNITGLSQGIGYRIGDEQNQTPPLRLTVNMKGSTNNRFDVWRLDSTMVQLNDIFSANAVGEFNGSEKIDYFLLAKGILQNESVWVFLPESLKEQFDGSSISGREEITVQITGNKKNDSIRVAIDGQLDLADVTYENPKQFLKAERVEGELSFQGSPEQLKGECDLRLGSVIRESVMSKPVQGSRILFDWGMILQDSLWIDRGEMDINPLAVRGGFSLSIGQMAASKNIDMRAELVFLSQDSVEIIRGTWLEGGLSCRLKGKTIDGAKQWMRLSGELMADSLNIRKDHLVNIEQIQGAIPFQVDVDLRQQVLLPESGFQPLSWVEYESQRVVYRNLSNRIGNLRIRQMDAAGYRLNNLIFDFNIEGGHVQIPWFNVELLDGNLGGSVAVHLGSGAKRDIAYEIHANVSRINSGALMEVKTPDKEETELNASLAFQGKGIDLEQEIDLDGFFHITKIGADFASTLLKAMDPQEKDRSIRLTRRLLNLGWKPKLFSFELRHGYVYPSLALTQPWFSPLRIPEYLEYGRLPLAFFLQSQFNLK